MSQTGTIYGYHDGNTYSLANIYDEKATEINILAGTSAKEMISVSFNTETGVDYYFDTEVISQQVTFYQSATYVAGTASSTKPITRIIPYLSNTHTDPDYALKLITDSHHYLTIGQAVSYGQKVTTLPRTLILIPKTQDENGNYVKSLLPSYQIEGVFFVDTSRFKKSYYSNQTYVNPMLLWSIPAIRQLTLNLNTHISLYVPAPSFDTTVDDTPCSFYLYSADQSRIVYVRDFDHNFFDEPFHICLQWFNAVDNPDYIYICYVNGELLFYMKRLASDEDLEYYYYCWDHIVIGGKSAWNATMSKYGIGNFSTFDVKNFRVSLISPVYQKIMIPANMLIRHNDANHYIPLTADAANTSAPYIAVRHGNTNFYTIK